MTFSFRHGLAALLLASASLTTILLPTTASAQALSAAVGNPLKRAQQLRSGSAAIAAVNQARAAAKTPVERTKVAQMAAYVYSNSGQFAAAAEQMQAFGAPPGQIARAYYNAHQYDRAISFAKRAGGADMQVLIAQSYIKTGDKRSAAGIYQQLIRSGGPKMEYLDNLASLQFTYDKPGYLQTVRQMIKIDPSPARYKALLFNLKNQNMSDQARLTLYQLMRQTGNLTEAADVQDMAKLAIIGGLPGVALGAVQEAQKANVIAASDPMTGKLIKVSGQQSTDALAKAPRQPATPVGRFAAGNAYFGAGQYPAAAQAYAAVVKANAPTADQARVQQGIALVRSGNASGGRAAFDAVTRGSPFFDVAQLWSLYASTH